MLIRCTRCLIPTTRPSSAFVGGVCTGCLNYEARAEVDWDARKNQLLRILESAQINSSGHDVVVASSGGKDSVFQVLSLRELGARPLVVTATTCTPTSVGRANIDNLARYATTVEITPNRTVAAKLNRLGLELVGDPSHREHLGVFAIPFQTAARYGIGTVFYGENPQREYSGPVGSEQQMVMNAQWVHEFGGLLGMRADDFVDLEGISYHDMDDYRLPSDKAMAGIQAHFLGQYLPWDSRANARIATASGMKVQRPTRHSHWDFENLDNAQTGLHDFFKYLKFGFGRVCDQVSIDIRYGLLSREEGYKIVRRNDGKFPWVYMGVSFEEVLDKIEISLDAFRNIVQTHCNRELFGHIDMDDFDFRLKEFCQ